MSAHTPGPWVLIDCAGRPKSAAATVEPKPPEMEGPNHWIVAEANGLRPEWEANARLIAAAPDMLAALREALAYAEAREDVTDGSDGTPQANDEMRLAQTLRAAIAKAGGL